MKDVFHLPFGQRVKYLGDIANLEGEGTIYQIVINQFGISYDIKLDDNRQFKRVSPHSFMDEYRWKLL